MPFIGTGTILDWIAIAGMVIVGIASIIGLIDREKKKKDKVVDAADDRLIKLLQGTVDSLEKQVNKLTIRVGDLSGKVSKLQTENDTLTRILQGKDDDSEKYRRGVNTALAKADKTHDIVKLSSLDIQKVNKNIERLAKLMEKHMAAVNKMIAKKP